VGYQTLIRRGRYERAGFELYGAAVTAARQRAFYAVIGVPDTLDGRFDMIAIFVFLIINRLTREPSPGPELAQAVFDALFSDMDVNLREMGVGDLTVGRKVRVMWEAFHGRSASYAAALRDGDVAALEAALGRNVWRDGSPPDGAARALGQVVIEANAHLDRQSLADLTRGIVDFPAVKDQGR